VRFNFLQIAVNSSGHTT